MAAKSLKNKKFTCENSGVDANVTQVPYDGDGLNPDHYFQSAFDIIDYGAFNPYYANGTVLYNFSNQEFGFLKDNPYIN